jgi:hypothetical protein
MSRQWCKTNPGAQCTVERRTWVAGAESSASSVVFLGRNGAIPSILSGVIAFCFRRSIRLPIPEGIWNGVHGPASVGSLDTMDRTVPGIAATASAKTRADTLEATHGSRGPGCSARSAWIYPASRTAESPTREPRSRVCFRFGSRRSGAQSGAVAIRSFTRDEISGLEVCRVQTSELQQLLTFENKSFGRLSSGSHVEGEALGEEGVPGGRAAAMSGGNIQNEHSSWPQRQAPHAIRKSPVILPAPILLLRTQ